MPRPGAVITSGQNPRVKEVAALLARAKARHQAGRCVLEGVRLIEDAWRAGHRPDFVLADADAPPPPVLALLADAGVPVLYATAAALRPATDTQTPQGVLAVVGLPRLPVPQPPQRTLILDALRDPGNVGTMLRTAAAAGVDAVLLAPHCADAFSPKVLRAGMGAHFRVPVVEVTWGQAETLCDGAHLFLADQHGDAPYDAPDLWTRERWALMISSEAHGPSEQARVLAHTRISIPMAAATESLNAAAAAAVVLFEAARQRRASATIP